MGIDTLRSKVEQNLKFVDNKLGEDKTPSPEDIDGIVGDGMQLAAIIGLCATNLADAKELLAMCDLQFMQDNRDLWKQPTILKKMMDGTLAKENALVTWADRLMSAVTHKMDFYRSVVSKHKEELRLNQQFNTQRNTQ